MGICFSFDKDSTYAKARELTRQHRKIIARICADKKLMNDVVERIFDHVSNDTYKGYSFMVCPDDINIDVWHATLKSQRRRIRRHPMIVEVTTETAYYRTRHGTQIVHDIVSRIQQKVLENAGRGETTLYFDRPIDIEDQAWKDTLRYDMKIIKKHLAPLRCSNENSIHSSIFVFW